MQKLLDKITFYLYNIRINKNTTGEKIMAEAAKNYTDEMVEAMVAAYEDAPTLATVEDLVIEFGKPKRSIISKLSSLGVYKAQPRNTTKQGTPVIRKADIADAIQEKLGTTQLPTLIKMSKNDLMTLAALVDGADYNG